MPCLTTSSASIIFVIVVSSVTCSFSQDKTLANPNPPNVLIITVDDLKDWVGYLDGYEGQVFTPNIDGLAPRGSCLYQRPYRSHGMLPFPQRIYARKAAFYYRII